MATSGAHNSHYKRREELDLLLDGFEQNLSMRVDALIDYCNDYADSILSVTSDDDDAHVSSRLDAILRHHSLAFNLPDAEPIDSQDTSGSPSARNR